MARDDVRSDDVLVVGGGVIGLAIAHRLAAAGHRVALVERRHPGAGASTVAAGILSPTEVGEWHGDAGDLNVRALAAWPDYAEELAAATDLPVGLRRCGSLRLDQGDEAGAAWVAATADAMRDRDVPAELLDADGCRSLVPGVGPARGGLYAPTDAAVDTELLVAALVEAARREGVELVHDEVVGLGVSGERVTGVELARGGPRPAATVVVAAGAWAGTATWLPAPCRPALVPVAGEAVLAAGLEPPLEVVLRSRMGSMAPRGVEASGARVDGRLWIGTSVRRVGFVDRPNIGAVTDLLARATRMLPAVASLDLLDVRVGLRPVSEDGLPHVGPTPVDGLLLATGHGREGIIHAPLAAAAIAHLVGHGALPAWARPLTPRPT